MLSVVPSVSHSPKPETLSVRDQDPSSGPKADYSRSGIATALTFFTCCAGSLVRERAITTRKAASYWVTVLMLDASPPSTAVLCGDTI
jgi:hypothetical protein